MSRWAWVLLPVLVALPVPLALPGAERVAPEVAWPVFWLALGGIAAAVAWVASASRPLALLLAWISLRALTGGTRTVPLETRGVLFLLGILAVGMLYRMAVALPREAERPVLLAILAAVGVNAVLAVGDLVRVPAVWLWASAFNWLTSPLPIPPQARVSAIWVQIQHWGWPQGLLGHPNHFGLFLAFGLPLGLWAMRRWPRWASWPIIVTWLALIVLSRSATAVLSIIAGLAVLWLASSTHGQRPSRAVTYMAVIVAGVVGAGLLFTRGVWPITLGNRLPVWTAALIEWWQDGNGVMFGWGLGAWAPWAMAMGGPVYARYAAGAGWWTQAHSEPVQLVVELGLLGLGLGAAVAWQAMRDSARALRAADDLGRTWAVVVVMGLLSMWVTIPLRVPALTLVAVFAAARVRARAA